MSHVGGPQFPHNAGRQATGRGERAPNPTQGLQNHNAQLNKNNLQRKRAKETRDRNAAAQQVAAGTPAPGLSTPASHQNIASSGQVPPRPSRPPAPRPTNTSPPLPRLPLGPLAPQRQPEHPYHSSYSNYPPNIPSTPGLHSFSSSPIPSREGQPELMRMPQNYQPTYPSFASLSSSTFSDPSRIADARPSPLTTDARPFTTEQLAQMDQVLSSFEINHPGPEGGQLPFDAGLGDTAQVPSTVPGNWANQNSQRGDDDDEQDVPDDADDDQYQEEPWNSPAGANDGVEGSNMHQNAQSSLEVTMHDVDVQKRKRKRVALVSSDSESDTTNHPRKKNKRRRKKKPNRKQESRSINGVDAERQRIVKATFGPIQKAVTTRLPWATASPSGDPGADDDEIEDLIDEAWDAGCDHLDINPDDIPPRTPQESKLINARISQVRGAIVTVADIFVPASYGFTDLNSLADPTPDNIAKAREHNRQLVEDLVGTFMYPDPTQTDDLSTICHHSVFQKVLNAAFFAKKGMNHRNHYFADKDELPLETLALIMDAVVCAIDRWKTGEHQTVAFTAEVYAPFHRTTMEFLAKWYNEFERDIYPENVARKLLRDMLTNGRCLLGAPLETAPAPKAMFPMHIFGLN